jgi:hypothetical protein
MCMHTDDCEHLLKLPGEISYVNKCRIMHIHTFTNAQLHMYTYKVLCGGVRTL